MRIIIGDKIQTLLSNGRSHVMDTDHSYTEARRDKYHNHILYFHSPLKGDEVVHLDGGISTP